MKIIALNLARLINAKHINFMLFVKTAITMFAVIGEKFAAVVESFLAAFDEENDVYLKHTRKFLTEDINTADVQRIGAFRRLRDVLKTFSFVQDEAQKRAAQKLLDVIDLYGGTDIPSLAIDARSGQLSNLIEDFEQDFPELVTLTSTGPQLANLKSANEEVLRLMSDRTEHDAEYGREAVAKARRKTDLAYRNLVGAINIAMDNGMAAELSPFAKYLNAEVERYKIGLGQGSGSSSNKPGSDSEEETDGGTGGTETAPTMKNATFKKADGTAIVLPFEVGTVIVYPDNTVGYKWSPNLEFMPKTNKTFKEVPIVDRETIALFHFADHTEEEIKQYVGTLLHAPANTTGCYWSPEVPETMPAEDTQYYELPIENDDNQGGGDQGGSTGGGNNGGYPPGYDPDADLDPGV